MPETKRKRGRPLFDPPWLRAVAETMAQGTTLRRALWRNGVEFTESQLRNIYRCKKFRFYYESAKLAFYREWGATSPKETRELLRTLGELD